MIQTYRTFLKTQLLYSKDGPRGIFRGLALFYYLHVRPVFKSGDIKVKVHGDPNPIFLRKNTSDVAVFHQIYLNKEYECRFLPKNASFIIDAGANIGLFSRWIGSKYKNDNPVIVGVEPDPENHRQCLHNMQHSYWSSIRLAALWHQGDILYLDDTSKSREWSRTVSKKGRGRSTEAETIESLITKEVTEALEYHRHETIIDILKIDIEGAEKEIFEKGNMYFLSMTKCLIIETHDFMRSGTSKAVLTKMQEYDFSCYTSGENLVFINNQLK